MRRWFVAALVAAPFACGAAVAAPTDDAARGHEVTRFADPEIVESSGLVVGDGLAVTINDSGDSARVFAVDLRTGETVGGTRFDGEAADLEALAPAGDGHVWVGDTGDNNRDRADVEVTRVPIGRDERAVAGETYHLRYPDGPQDAEALLAHPVTGRLYVVSKSPLRGQVYAAPARLDADGDNVLKAVGEAPGLVTDGAFFPDGRHLVLRTYFRATILSFPGLEPVADFALPRQQQGEGLAVAADGTVYLSSEGAGQPILRLELPAAALAALRGTPQPSATTSPSPSPTGSAPADPRDDGAGDEGADGPADGGFPWVLVVFGGAGVLLLGGIVRLLRG